MQDLRTAAWPVPYSGTLRRGSLGEDHKLGEPANRTVFLHRWPTVQKHVQPLTDNYWHLGTPENVLQIRSGNVEQV